MQDKKTGTGGSLFYSKKDFLRCEAAAMVLAVALLCLLYPLISAQGSLTANIISACFLLSVGFAHWVCGLVMTNRKVRRAVDVLAGLYPELDRSRKMELLRAALAFKGCFSGSKLLEAFAKLEPELHSREASAPVLEELRKLEKDRLYFWLALPLILLVPAAVYLM